MTKLNKLPLILILLSLFTTYSASAAIFTPNHLEGTFRGNSFSEEEPDYCTLDIRREELGQQVQFLAEITHHGVVIGRAQLDSVAVLEQLNNHQSYIELKAKNEFTQINITGSVILNFSFMKFDNNGKLAKHLICSQR